MNKNKYDELYNSAFSPYFTFEIFTFEIFTFEILPLKFLLFKLYFLNYTF